MICIKFSLCRAEKGIKLVQEGQYEQAIAMFTEAIKCDAKDYRYNRTSHNVFMCTLSRDACAKIIG